MSRTNNEGWRIDYLRTVAIALVDKAAYDALPAEAQRNQRVVWQKQLQKSTGCTAQTARTHIRKALENGIPNPKV